MSGHLRLSNLSASNLVVDFVSSDLIPVNSNISLGSVDKPFKDLYISSSTIHMGDAILSEDNGIIISNGPIQVGTEINSNIRIDSNFGIVFGTTQLDNTGLKFNDGLTVIDSNIFNKLEVIASDQLTRNSDDFGYITNYTLNISDVTNDIVSINNGILELGRLFNKDDSLNLNTFIVKTVTNNFYPFINDGTVSLFDYNEQNHIRNKRLDDINISVNLTEEQVIVPIKTNTTLRDVFPIDVLDMNKKMGRIKFKSDFDTIGSFYFTNDTSKMSGICNLKNFVQVSDPQFINSFVKNDQSINLSKYEYIVDCITYYNLPILFEAQKDGDDLTSYEYYISSLSSNRKDDIVYNNSFETLVEKVFGQDINISNITKQSYANHSKTFYPAIRAIKWKNTYATSFTNIENNDEIKSKLKWTDIEDIYIKYTTGTNTGENWIIKLVEITFAYIKYGKPLKPLNSTEMIEVQNIMTKITDNKSLINLNVTNMEITIKKDAFAF